jgi:hypothetical protein
VWQEHGKEQAAGGALVKLRLLLRHWEPSSAPQQQLNSSANPQLCETSPAALTLRLGAEAEWYWSAHAKSLTEVKLPQ